MENYLNLFHNAPIATSILKAEGFNVEMANPEMLNLWRRDKTAIGLNLLEVMPEIVGQPYVELIRSVFKTGQPHTETGAKVLLNSNGKMETIFMDYSYTPIFGKMQRPTALLIMGTDISEREINKQAIQQSDRNLRNLIMSSPVPMCVFRGENLRIDAVNDSMMELWLSQRMLRIKEVRHVLNTGVTYKAQIDKIDYTFAPIRDGLGKVSGIVVTGSKA
ncbi:PAS domain-containing protein [Pedobacter metabolipauper]|uniref:PAS domain-containing protein n=1 Tax=Pedobacter metabolipauper TaxID=425513 RepID=A0A4R6SR50_9SPHI|nr:PAS domain-containing protein [Pedobacter metabolipauper]TDQ06705.1 PAS domain-containing protein [Pedobacter metabolipauper]